jgi:excisionase family DNA binding protein
MDKMEDRTIIVPEAGRRVGLSKNAAYKAAKAGEIPSLRFGRKLRVPIVAFERMLEGVKGREAAK